jgi:hypothetical protein
MRVSSILRAARNYEEWLGTQLRLLPADLDLKRAAMRESPFAFFRGSFFRWAKEWKHWCPEAANAPRVLAVGDPHVENFGTWRDAEGRLIWGVNDFDEAWRLPYTSDLVRLSASAILASRERTLSSPEGSLLDAIIHGYTTCLEARGQPFVLAEQHAPLRAMALARLKDAQAYWRKMEACAELRGRVPRHPLRIIRQSFPAGTVELRWVHRLAGIGSLGRERITAIGSWKGGKVAREAKAFAPSDVVLGAAGIDFSSAIRSAVLILSHRYGEDGSFAGLPRTVPGLPSTAFRKGGTSDISFGRWDGRLRMCTWPLAAGTGYPWTWSVETPAGYEMRHMPRSMRWRETTRFGPMARAWRYRIVFRTPSMSRSTSSSVV